MRPSSSATAAETEERGIRGQASPEQAEALLDAQRGDAGPGGDHRAAAVEGAVLVDQVHHDLVQAGHVVQLLGAQVVGDPGQLRVLVPVLHGHLRIALGVFDLFLDALAQFLNYLHSCLLLFVVLLRL